MTALAHWADQRVESMYDKTLLAAEIAAIKKHIHEDAHICDAGCGEGEGTLEYAALPGARVEAFDLYPERLELASRRLFGVPSVTLRLHDVRDPISGQYDIVISQRLLINLSSWDEQKQAFRNLAAATKKGGLLIVSEGSINGANKLNKFRAMFGLLPIPVPQHNLWVEDGALVELAERCGMILEKQEDFGAYYLLTRGVQPALRDEYHWASGFNRACATPEMNAMIPNANRFSRVKVWAFAK